MNPPESIKLYIKPYCGWCHEAIDWLKERQIAFDTLDVTSDIEAMNEMVRKTGQTLTPVIDVDGEILADFDVEQLDLFWSRITSA